MHVNARRYSPRNEDVVGACRGGIREPFGDSAVVLANGGRAKV